LNPRYVHQRGIRSRGDQQIKVAAVGISAVNYRANHPRIAGAMRFDDAPDSGAMRLESDGWFHS